MQQLLNTEGIPDPEMPLSYIVFNFVLRIPSCLTNCPAQLTFLPYRQ